MFSRFVKSFNTAVEGIRGTAALNALYLSKPAILAAAPHAGGQPVMVIPGFTGNDGMTAPLRHCLTEKGYKVYGWDGGINTGFNQYTADHLVKRLREVFEANGGKKVSLIGHSLGGIYARELARDFPEMVDRVITIASPFGMKDENAPALLVGLYRLVNFGGDMSELSDHDLHLRRLTPPPGVPATSIYSLDDGIVPWRGCINPKCEKAENIAVSSSHLGLLYHPLTVTAVLDRLSADTKDWKAFKAEDYSSVYAATRAATEQDIPANPNWVPGKTSRPLFKPK